MILLTGEMKKMDKLRWLWVAGWIFLTAAVSTAADHGLPRPRYIFLHCDEKAIWRSRGPGAARDLFENFTRTLRPPLNPRLRVGLAITFSTLDQTTPVLAGRLVELLRASEATSVPLLIGLDGQQWWQRRPDLWNWWDPGAPGYNPANVHNVEWTGWDPAQAVKIGWRNWGRQLRVAPAPNIASPRVIEEHLKPLRALTPILERWRRELGPERGVLFGGLKVGWEAGTGFNAFYYPDGNAIFERWPNTAAHDPQTGLKPDKGLAGGLAQLGYAAVKTAGLKTSGTLTREDLATVTARYLEALARAAHEAGLPRELIYTHQGGTPPVAPEQRLPLWPAINEWSTPGWSLYHRPPEAWPDLKPELERHGRSSWAAVEWLWGAATPKGWADHLHQTLSAGDCRLVTIYNWTRMVDHDPVAQSGIRQLVEQWAD